MASSLAHSGLAIASPPPSAHRLAVAFLRTQTWHHHHHHRLHNYHSHFISHSKSLLPICSFSSPIGGASTSYGSSFSLFYDAQPYSHNRRRSLQMNSANLIKAAFIFQLFESFIRFVTKAPMKLFVQRLEADIDRAAKMVKTGASVVVEVAKDVDEVAEEVEKFAERAEAIAEKVLEKADTIEERVDEVLDVLDGDKKVVFTSVKVEENNSAAGGGRSSTINTSIEAIVVDQDATQSKTNR